MNAPWALGLMTGTVLDGMIDIALIRTDGEEVYEFGPWTLVPYDRDVKDLLPRAVEAALDWRFEGPEPPIFQEAEHALTIAQADAVSAFLAQSGIAPGEVAAIGFHGQTVLHRGPRGGIVGQTRQLGDGTLMAERTGIRTVYDLRSADVRAGGQGAPLAATYHAALLRNSKVEPPAAVLNLGGVGNVTWWGGGDEIIAFDTGPANAPLNDWIRQHGAGEFDTDGRIARQGRVDEERLHHLLQHPYLLAAYPKSLDRHDFSAAMADGLSLEDGAATLAAFTAGAVGKGLDLLPRRPQRLVVSGGGRKNPALMEALRVRATVDVVPAEVAGWRGDAVEAECFAFLAARALKRLPISYPMTTGVPAPMTGGRVAG